jgi:hypothetical protein
MQHFRYKKKKNFEEAFTLENNFEKMKRNLIAKLFGLTLIVPMWRIG